jgi:lysophospholipase L1-like esterase
MRNILFLFLLLIFTALKPLDHMSNKEYTFLALGDSYTIGESIPYRDNFPCQTIDQLKASGLNFKAPDILATTGWTTDELQAAVKVHHFASPYTFVSLLIGVNNQYRGRTIREYEEQLESLLKQSINLAGNEARHVIVLSIPDWGVTPFATGSNRFQIAQEIDEFNAASKRIAEGYHVNYINITEWTRSAAQDPSLLSPDGLHPSAKEYQRWASKISALIIGKLAH